MTGEVVDTRVGACTSCARDGVELDAAGFCADVRSCVRTYAYLRLGVRVCPTCRRGWVETATGLCDDVTCPGERQQ